MTEPTVSTPEGAWIEAVHEQYAGALFVFAYRVLGERGAAEELVQDTLLRAWRAADRYDPARGSLGAWLFTIARNLAIDQHRRRAVRPSEDAAAVPPGPGVDESVLDRAVEAWHVADALQRLTPEHRAVIVEVYYRDASVSEAADRLGIPRGTVKSRLYYGLRALRLILQEIGVVA